jgi:hypothetical protein
MGLQGTGHVLLCLRHGCFCHAVQYASFLVPRFHSFLSIRFLVSFPAFVGDRFCWNQEPSVSTPVSSWGEGGTCWLVDIMVNPLRFSIMRTASQLVSIVSK